MFIPYDVIGVNTVMSLNLFTSVLVNAFKKLYSRQKERMRSQALAACLEPTVVSLMISVLLLLWTLAACRGL